MTDSFSCIEIKSKLSAYFDEELSLDEKTTVENHLMHCCECEKELNLIRKTSGCLKNFYKNNEPDCVDLNISEKVMADLNICSEISGNLSAFIDGELPKAGIIKISEHLLKCKYCRNDYDLLKKTGDAVKNYFNRSLEDLKIPRIGFNENIISQIIFAQKRKKLIYSTAAVAILAVIIYSSVNLINLKSPEKDNIHKVKFLNNYTQGKSELFSLPSKK